MNEDEDFEMEGFCTVRLSGQHMSEKGQCVV